MISSSMEIYTDGSAIRNPGPAGCAYLIRYWEVDDSSNDMPLEKEITGSTSFRLSSNNRMEMMAAITGLEKIIKGVEDLTFEGLTQINLMSDSEYLVKAINLKWIDKWQSNGWMTSSYGGKKSKPVKNQDLWQQLLTIQTKLRSLGINLTMSHVEGHAGNEYNEKCDQLCKDAANATSGQLIDTVYEQSQKY